jgi:hypothetical protein
MAANLEVSVDGFSLTPEVIVKLQHAIYRACGKTYGYMKTWKNDCIELTLCYDGRKRVSQLDKTIIESVVIGWSFGIHGTMPRITWDDEK